MTLVESDTEQKGVAWAEALLAEEVGIVVGQKQINATPCMKIANWTHRRDSSEP